MQRSLSTDFTLRILTLLSRLLSMERKEGVLKRSLPLVVAAAGGATGALYVKQGLGLVLVAHSGMPASLRQQLTYIDAKGPTWFVAQRAAVSRMQIVDAQFAQRGAAYLEEGALVGSWWAHAAAQPIIADGELYGVLVVAVDAGRALDPDALLTLELVSNTLGIHLASLSDLRDDSSTVPVSEPDTHALRALARGVPTRRALRREVTEVTEVTAGGRHAVTRRGPIRSCSRYAGTSRRLDPSGRPRARRQVEPAS